MKRKASQLSDDGSPPPFKKFAPSGLQANERQYTDLHYAAKEGDAQKCLQILAQYRKLFLILQASA